MLIMETIRKVLVRHRCGEKIRKISRDFNISRNTVRKIIASSRDGIIKGNYIRTVQPNPKLSEYIEPLEKLLRDNKHVRPKRTDKALFEELKTLGYNGSYSAVNRYSYQWKHRISGNNKAACIPLAFSPGEAYQFDWSTEYILLDGELITVKAAHFILCYSRKKFIYVYPNETQEMVFDAHVRAFQFFGGTPTRGIYDNMKTAVDKVLRGGERQWNNAFERLCAHYMIEPTACTPRAGNEKGRVERQVQIDREQFFTPLPNVRNLQELNDLLLSQLLNYNNTHKHPEYKDKTLNDIYEEEKGFLVSAPVLFDSCKESNVKVSFTCLARYDRTDYSVDCSCAGKIVQCRAYADTIVFVYNGKEVGRHQRLFTKGGISYVWQHYLPLLARKPGALRNGAPFVDMELPHELNEVRKHLEQSQAGIKDFARILAYISTESMESVVFACAKALSEGTVSKDIILNILLRKKDEQLTSAEVVPIQYPSLKYIPNADCTSYNRLLKLGGDND